MTTENEKPWQTHVKKMQVEKPMEKKNIEDSGK